MRSVHGTRGIFRRTAVICTAVLLLSVSAGCDLGFSSEDPDSLSVCVTEADVSVGAVFCAAYPAFGEAYEWMTSADGVADVDNGTVTAGGGVVANGYLREKLSQACERAHLKLVLPEKKHCTDNAAMIAAEGLIQYRAGNFSPLSLNARASIPLR